MRVGRVVLGLLAVAALPIQAANILTRTGTATGFWMATSGQTEAYVSWNQPVGTAFSNVVVKVLEASLVIAESIMLPPTLNNAVRLFQRTQKSLSLGKGLTIAITSKCLAALLKGSSQ